MTDDLHIGKISTDAFLRTLRLATVQQGSGTLAQGVLVRLDDYRATVADGARECTGRMVNGEAK